MYPALVTLRNTSGVALLYGSNTIQQVASVDQTAIVR